MTWLGDSGLRSGTDSRIGTMSGLFFAFGIGGIGAAVPGHMADAYAVMNAYEMAAWPPALGIIAIFLPRVQHDRAH